MNQIDKQDELMEAGRGIIAEAILLLPNFLKLLYRLMQDQHVPASDKALMLATVAYVISPLDFLPDMVPFLGQVDDVLLLALVIKRLLDSVSYDMLLESWDGKEELLQWIEKILHYAVLILPPRIYNLVVKKADEDY